jgi:hypothetical protein
LRELARVCLPEGKAVLLEHVLSSVRPVALLERLWSPIHERTIGCHPTRQTIETARALGLTIETEQKRFFGAFRLVTARPPDVR